MAKRQLEFVFTGNAASASRAFRQVGVESNTLTGRMKGLGGTVARTFGAFAGAYGASQAIRKVATDTVEFDKAMRNVNSIAQLNEKQYGRLSKSVLRLAGPTAQAPKVLAEGLYDLVSSGFESADALKVLRASAKAATAGLTSAEVATGTVAAVLNAYHQNASQAQDVSDVLFRTVDRGVVSFEELSGSIGDVLPFSASLGVNLREVGASVATMTKAGINAPETMTRIKNVMVSLIKPGADLSAALNKLGFESGEALIKQKGFQGALDALVGSTDGSKRSIAELFPNVRALGGVLALTGANSKAAAKDLAGMADAAGATDKALSQQSKSISFRWEQLKAKVSALSIEFGEKLVPAVSSVLSVLGDDRLTGKEKLSRLAAELKKVVAAATKAIPQLLIDMAPKVIGAGVVLGGAIARGIAEGFFKSGVLGKVLIGATLLRVFGGAALISRGGGMLAATVMGGFSKAMAEGSFFKSIAQQVGRGAGVQGAAWTLGAGRSLATSLMSSVARAIPMVGATVGITDVIGKFVTDGPKAGLERAGATAGGALVGGLIGMLAGPGGAMIGAGIGASLGGPIEAAFRKLFGGTPEIDRFALKVRWADQVLARSAQTRQALAGRVAAQQAMVKAANVKSQRATVNLRAAEENLSAARRTHGADSEEARRAEARLAVAKERSNRATARANRLGQMSGPIRDAAKVSYRSALAVQKQAVSVAEDEARKSRRAFRAAQERGAGQAELARKANRWMDAEKKLAAQQKASMRLLKQLSSDLGPKVAASMNRQADAALRNLKRQQALRRSFQDLPAPIVKAGSSISTFEVTATGRLRKASRSVTVFGSTASRQMRKASSAATESAPLVSTSITDIIGSYNRGKSSIQSSGSPQRKRRGGLIGRFRSGGEVAPIMVSPGEMIVHGRDGMMVPGRAEARDSVFTYAPVGATVLTADGQQRLAAGESLSRARARQAPHFAAGGLIKRPVVTGGTRSSRGVSNRAIGAVHSLAAQKLKKLRENAFNVGGPAGTFDGRLVAGWILPILNWARAHGWTGHITSGYRSPEHNATIPGASPTSNHLSMTYPGGAIDVGGFGARAEGAALAGVLARYPRRPNLVWGGPVMSDWGHFSATGHRKGGRVRGFKGGGVVRQITDALLKRGYSAAAAAGIVGNAYRESRWNPASVGTGGGGLWGFTTSPVSLADLKNAASQKGVNWTDIDFQTGFMDRHMPSGLKARLNALKDPVAAARLFMDEWERPGIPAFGDRAWGAKVAMKQLNRRRSVATGKARKQLARVKALWRGVKKHGTTKAGRKRARLAGRNARGAVRAAGSYDFAGTYSRIGRSRKFTRKGYAGIRANVRAKKAGRRPGGSYSPTGGVRVPPGWSGGGAPGGGAPAPGLFAGLPEPIQRMLGVPGLTGDQRRDILDLALGRAGATEPTDDDRAALEAIIGFETGRRSVAQGKFNRLSRRLGRMTFGGKAGALAGKGLNEATAKRGRQRIKQIDKQLAAIQPGKSGKLTAAQKKKKAALRAEKAAISKRLGVYDRTLTGRDDALGRITGSDSSILDAERSIRDLDEKEKDDAAADLAADLAAELKALREEIEKQNALQARGSGIDYLEMRRALMDIISGDLAGRANPTYRGYDVPAVNF